MDKVNCQEELQDILNNYNYFRSLKFLEDDRLGIASKIHKRSGIKMSEFLPSADRHTAAFHFATTVIAFDKWVLDIKNQLISKKGDAARNKVIAQQLIQTAFQKLCLHPLSISLQNEDAQKMMATFMNMIEYKNYYSVGFWISAREIVRNAMIEATINIVNDEKYVSSMHDGVFNNLQEWVNASKLNLDLIDYMYVAKSATAEILNMVQWVKTNMDEIPFDFEIQVKNEGEIQDITSFEACKKYVTAFAMVRKPMVFKDGMMMACQGFKQIKDEAINDELLLIENAYVNDKNVVILPYFKDFKEDLPMDLLKISVDKANKCTIGLLMFNQYQMA